MKEPALVRFGDKVREVRKSKGVSQERLANIAGIERSYMGFIERGMKNVGLLHIYKIAEALEVRPSELID